MKVIIFEDSGWRRFLPLVYLRPVFDLLCGMQNLLDRVQSCINHSAEFDKEESVLWCRSDIADVVAEQSHLQVNHTEIPAESDSAITLLLNGRGFWKQIPSANAHPVPWIGTAGDQHQIACLYADNVLMQKLSPEVLLDEARFLEAVAGVPRHDISDHLKLFEWPWQVVLANEQAMHDDWCQQDGLEPGVHCDIQNGVHLLNREAIHIGSGTNIKPCVVIDAEDGPVWIGPNVRILPHSYVQGPAYIGEGSLLQPGAVVHAGSTIGPVCKIGGEIEASIMHGYSNKQHDGFLGHSYVGSWVNIAADCVNSDLKNTYGTVRVPINGRDVDTGELFVGMLIGDYSKTGINVSFPTGSVVGCCSSIFAPNSPKFVPSFTWIDQHAIVPFDEQKGIAIAKKAMARRKREFTAAQEVAFLGVRKKAVAIEHATDLLQKSA